MSPPKPPYGAPIPLPHLVRGKCRYQLHALDGAPLRFRVTDAGGLIGEGGTPDLALADLQGKAPPPPQAPAFLAWVILRGNPDSRVVKRAYVAGFADRHGVFKVAIRGRHWTPSDADREIPRLFDSRESALRPGLTKGERVEPRLVLGETLPLYVPSEHPEGAVWADLLHDADPRIPRLLRVTDRAALARARFSRLTVDQLLAMGNTWRQRPPSLEDIARHAARSKGAGVWAYREKRGGPAAFYSMALDPSAPGRYLTQAGAVALPRTSADYELAPLGEGWWRPVHHRSLGPLAWPDPPLADGDEVLVLESTRHGYCAERATFRRLEGEGANRTALVSRGPRGFNVPVHAVTLLARGLKPSP